jgi:5-methylcytosine-specific restriction protein B
MTEEPRLDLEKTYRAIRKAALERRFLCYGDIAEASGVSWNAAFRRIAPHLDLLVARAHERGWPLLSAIVVNKEDVTTGKLEGTSRDGLLSAAKEVGITVDDPEKFVEEQQKKVFEWAPTSPQTLNRSETQSEGSPTELKGARFVHFLGPVLRALHAFGGEAKPKDVVEWIAKNEPAAKSEVGGLTRAGNPSFDNRIGWARFYLVKAGLIDDKRRGIWKLTQEGQDTDLDYVAALEIVKEVRKGGWNDDDEDEPAPATTGAVAELFDDPQRQFWFAGAAWDDGDQLERFLNEGIWQNGYEEKFSDLVRQMRPGDRIAIKSSFVRKRDLPFNAGGKSVSCMRIKAIGTIKTKSEDGQTVGVDWTPVEPPRDWFLYTYRTTLSQADPADDHARRLILFTFANVPQDYQYWVQVPYFARKFATGAEATLEPLLDDEEDVEPDTTDDAVAVEKYTLGNIVDEGCFLSREVLETALQRLSEKKNIILQGPPGTGKTWLAKRLAYALIGTKDRTIVRSRVRSVQFHPSLSYEDFVRGWRPTDGGKLELADGILLKMVQAALAVPAPFVLIIEEINRGNPAQAFGEMLTLLEDTKRRQDEALELAYGREGERIYIPPNLHVIGTMNIADRSLALVDLALRRRFAFISLKPQLGEAWRAWCAQKGLDETMIDMVEQRIGELNKEISDDRSLGPQFRIGHSYVTPQDGLAISNGKAWFSEIVETEIAPMLEEYWYDAPAKASEAKRRLLAGLA